MIAKEQAKREQAHPVCLHAVEKVEKVNTQNDYETKSKRSTDIEKTGLFFVFFKCV